MKENYSPENEDFSFACIMKKLASTIIITAVCVIIGLILLNVIYRIKDPVEIEKPDVIEYENNKDSLQQIINHLDSIKNGKIEETYNLSDSATLNLFNELTSK